MLTGVGFTQPGHARRVVNFGGVTGAILGALMIQRLGSRLTMLGMSAAPSSALSWRAAARSDDTLLL